MRMYAGFRAGVDRGGLTTDFEVKMLILYLLRESGEPVKLSCILSAVAETATANYFEVTDGACRLLEQTYISVVDSGGDKSYRITKKGREAFETLGKDLPRAVKDKVLAQLKVERSRDRLGDAVKVSTEQAADGCLMTLEIRDVGSDLMKMTVLLPDKDVCKQVEARFLQDPALLYKGVVALLTGSFRYLGKLMDNAGDGLE